MSGAVDAARPSLGAIVLAGGRSSRLGGSPKAQLRGDRGTLLEMAVAAVRDAGAQAVVVVGPDEGDAATLHAREDPPYSGPAAALAAGVRELTGRGIERVFVVACDMPGMSSALPLLAEAADRDTAGHEEADAWLAVTEDGERTQNLLGLYAFTPLARAVDQDLRDAPMRAVTTKLRVSAVRVPDSAADDADTWEDAARLGLRVTDRPGAHGHEPGWREAEALVHARAFEPPTPFASPLAESIGERLAVDVRSPIDVPHYASSAMDGFAVAGPPPWRLSPQGTAEPARAAGPESSRAEPIVTGGLVPRWASGVVRSEYATAGEGTVAFTPGSPEDELEPGRHVRPAGRELRVGGLVASADTIVTEPIVAFAAVAGLDSLPVVPRIPVDLVLTGSEVIEAGIPGPGEVRDVFAPQLPSAVGRLGGRVGRVTRIPDDADLTREALLRSEARVVLTTGGTGRSSADHVRSTLESLGADFVVSGLRLRPGHPSMLARLPSGTWVLGLPGNPLAAMTALLVLGCPLLAALRGVPAPDRVQIDLSVDVPGGPLERIVPVAPGPAGAWLPCDGTGSNMLRGLASARALASIAPTGARAGDVLDAIWLPWA